MFRGTIFFRHVIAILAAAFILGCSGGSPVSPDATSDLSAPRQVLTAFADACIDQDLESACALLLYPDRWRHTLELSSDVLPLYGRALKESTETNRERDCYRYRVRMQHSDDPQQRVLENRIYVVRIRDFEGRVSPWRIDFIYPGDGQEMLSRHRAQAEITAPIGDATDRDAQWGTMYNHASILTRAILAYYFLMYPDDYAFTGPWGYFNPHNYQYVSEFTHPGPVEEVLGIDFDSYENMPPDAFLLQTVPTALVQAGSADEDVFCGEFNADGSINFLRDIYLSFDGMLYFKATADFDGDDDTFLKGFAHFLTPQTQDILETNYAPFDDIGILGGTDNASVKALDWALGNGVLGPYDVLGIIDMRASMNRKSFPQALALMDQAKNAPNNFVRAERLANAFYTFGYSLHLLEDLSCPAHVRNDMHGVPILSSIPGLGGLQPDPIEEWSETITPGFVAETIGMFNTLVAEHDPIARDASGFPGDWILQNLYLNAENPDFASVEALFEYTAKTANRMCFSEDSIYVSTNYDAANTDYYPYLTKLDLDFFGKTVLYGKPGWEISDEEHIVAIGNGLFDTWRSWFWTTHWFSDPEVGDVEDALRDGWDILTVADEDDEDYYINSVTGVREQQWKLLFPMVVRTGAAYMHEFYLASRK